MGTWQDINVTYCLKLVYSALTTHTLPDRVGQVCVSSVAYMYLLSIDSFPGSPLCDETSLGMRLGYPSAVVLSLVWVSYAVCDTACLASCHCGTSPTSCASCTSICCMLLIHVGCLTLTLVLATVM